MKTYPLIEKYLPEIAEDPVMHHEFVNMNYMMEKIEAALAKGSKVYSGWHSHERGQSCTDRWQTTYWDHSESTHEALLIGIQPIKPQRVEFETVMGAHGIQVLEAVQFTGKKVKVTIEELRG